MLEILKIITESYKEACGFNKTEYKDRKKRFVLWALCSLLISGSAFTGAYFIRKNSKKYINAKQNTTVIVKDANQKQR